MGTFVNVGKVAPEIRKNKGTRISKSLMYTSKKMIGQK
jgi:hypothetical protein